MGMLAGRTNTLLQRFLVHHQSYSINIKYWHASLSSELLIRVYLSSEAGSFVKLTSQPTALVPLGFEVAVHRHDGIPKSNSPFPTRSSSWFSYIYHAARLSV